MKMRSAIVLSLVLLPFAAPLRADGLADRIAAIAKKYEATVGVSAEDTLTGRKVSVRGGEAFPMGSVYKLPIALAVLHRAGRDESALDTNITIEPGDFSPGHSPIAEQAGGQSVSNPLGTILVYALRDSDNTASDALLRFLGGPKEVMTYLNFIGVRGIDVSRSEKQIAADIAKKGNAAYWKDPRDSATPDAIVLLLRMYDEKVSSIEDSGRRFIQDMLLHSDGGKNRIRAGAPSDALVLDKSGTMPGVVNDAGIIAASDARHRILLAVFTKGWSKTPSAKREQLIADVTRAVYEDFTKK
jgi:beta-lactamase class A